MKESLAVGFMEEAGIEGRKALPACRPNPPVGCVLVRDGKIIARGHTQPPGQYHAEAMALSQCAEVLTDVSVFVTLEPCSFFGRTPSCARALVARQVQAVYVGLIDPHPKNQGAGLDIIRQAGIPVYTGILENWLRQELEPYLST